MALSFILGWTASSMDSVTIYMQSFFNCWSSWCTNNVCNICNESYKVRTLKKHMCYHKIGQCAQIMPRPHSRFNNWHNWESLRLMKTRESSFQKSSLIILHLYSDPKLEMTIHMIYNSLLTGWDNSQINPMAKIVCRFQSLHTEAPKGLD